MIVLTQMEYPFLIQVYSAAMFPREAFGDRVFGEVVRNFICMEKTFKIINFSIDEGPVASFVDHNSWSIFGRDGGHGENALFVARYFI